MIDPKNGPQLLQAAASAQQLHMAMAGMRLHLAGQLQLTLLATYWSGEDAPLLDERAAARKIAEAAVMHADALIEAASRTPSAADGLLRR